MKAIYEGIIYKQFLVKNVERIYAQDEINIVNCYKLREILKQNLIFLIIQIQMIM